MKIFLTILLLIILYGLTIYLFSCFSYEDKADYLIILGSGLYHDKETDVMLDRTNRAITYLKRYSSCKAIVSGGITSRNSVSEASVMKRILMEHGIEENRIICEEQSLNTSDNMRLSGMLMEENKTCVVCSSEYHVLRAVLLARKYGYRCHHISCRSSFRDLMIHIPLEEIILIVDLLQKN